jgi:hypothetical protein
MSSLKSRMIKNSVIVAIVAVVLNWIIVLISWTLFLKIISFAIDKTSIIDYRVRILSVVLNPRWASFIVSGFLTGVFIGFASKYNWTLTTIFTLLLIIFIYITMFLHLIQGKGSKHALIYIYNLSIHLVLMCPFIILGVWLVSRIIRKTGRQQILGRNQ